MGNLLMGPFLGWPFDSAREVFALLVIVVVLFAAFALISISLTLLLEGLLRGLMSVTRGERTRERVMAKFVNDLHSQRVSGAARFHRALPSLPLEAPSAAWHQKKAS